MADPITTICITGADGSGKTTQIARLRDRLTHADLTVSVVTVWDAFTDPAVAQVLPIAGPSDIHGYLALLGPNSRPHFLFHALHLALEQAWRTGPRVILLDGYWYKYFAAEAAHGGDPAVLQALASSFPEPDLTFHLDVGVDEAARRKAHHTGYESGFGRGAGGFTAFQHRVRGHLDELARDRNWVHIHAGATPEELTARLWQQIGDSCELT